MSDHPRYGRRRRGRAVVVLALLTGAGAYALSAGWLDDRLRTDPVPEATPSPASTAVPRSRTDRILERAVRNPDGSLTVTLDERETGDLVAAALARAPVRRVRDVAVELVEPIGGADGRMVVDGRLDDAPVPVRAVVDLDVVERRIRPTVRDLQVGPLPLSAEVRADLTRQLRALALVGEGRFAVDGLATEAGHLVLSGRRR